MALRIAADITKGVKPSLRYGTLVDPQFTGTPGGDRFAPKYLLVINGTTLDETITDYIQEITYDDNEELYDEMRVTLAGMIDDPKTGRSIPIPNFIQESVLFSEGNIMWLYAGYGSNLQLIGGTEIVKREFGYSTDASVTVVGYEPLHRMAQEYNETAKTYKGQRSSDIVKSIARKGAYSGAIGALFSTDSIGRLPIFTPRAEVQKADENDYKFLKRMADVRGWKLFTRFDDKIRKFQLFYGPDYDKSDGLFRYEYNNLMDLEEDKVLSFSPTINTIDQNTQVEITTINEDRKKNITQQTDYRGIFTTADRKFVGENTDFKNQELKNPVEYRFQAFGVSRKIIATRPFKDEKEAKKFVIQWARKHIKNFITGSGSVIGNEFLQSRQNHYFMGMGETFSGTQNKPAKWYLKRVTHTIVNGGGGIAYKTDFDCRKVIDFLPDDELQANPAVQGKKKKSQSILSPGDFV